MTALTISNAQARALWLSAHGLATPPTGKLDAPGIIHDLGFVQLDSIQIVSRAHHHIMWSRNANYREPMMDKLLGKQQAVFEHFTHDASVLPMEFLPMWRRQFARMREKISRSGWWGKIDPDLLSSVKARVAEEGPLCTRDFEHTHEGPKEMWQRPPHKRALDFLWFSGELATCHRKSFTKHYDLAERVFPADLREQEVPDAEQIDWLSRAALHRIGFGTPGEIRKFWDATTVAETARWAEAAPDLVPVEVETTNKTRIKALACPDIEARLEALTAPTSRLRILNPFDPAIRDRARLKRLFGFDYTVEMFVPAAKRQWGYYVFPLLEGSRFIGRLEAKADRKAGTLTVMNRWSEPGVRPSKAREDKLAAELTRLCRLAGLDSVIWACDR
ncbi:winged helix-turn-helix domain-containing protein [Oceanicola sp. D3]|uniref:winged helix-turn-helix domain-containing protein n=1 Tax=Oceanicola sp. D3 TaxID=2587163 RepID=UPI0011215E83|nr:crosslink repair DNA glycosylase YcaQ family protein [Oceanicola sp. D3]QDC11134.1 winged helix-turn-helix domain-containing protein [Oceanicola sp. D3]